MTEQPLTYHEIQSKLSPGASVKYVESTLSPFRIGNNIPKTVLRVLEGIIVEIIQPQQVLRKDQLQEYYGAGLSVLEYQAYTRSSSLRVVLAVGENTLEQDMQSYEVIILDEYFINQGLQELYQLSPTETQWNPSHLLTEPKVKGFSDYEIGSRLHLDKRGETS